MDINKEKLEFFEAGVTIYIERILNLEKKLIFFEKYINFNCFLVLMI